MSRDDIANDIGHHKTSHAVSVLRSSEFSVPGFPAIRFVEALRSARHQERPVAVGAEPDFDLQRQVTARRQFAGSRTVWRDDRKRQFSLVNLLRIRSRFPDVARPFSDRGTDAELPHLVLQSVQRAGFLLDRGSDREN